MTKTQVPAFSHAALPVVILHEVARHPITETTVVVNLAPIPARIDEDLGGYIAPVSSTVLTAGSTVTGDLLVLLMPPDTPLHENHFRALGWTDVNGTGQPDTAPETAMLLKSPRERVGTVQLIPADVICDDDAPIVPAEFEAWINLWFSPADTDCGIHREHAFIETHTQVMGVGRMQKFRDNRHETLFEDQILSRGQTQQSMFGRWRGGRFAYPWHQYRADTAAVWLAIEYHPVGTGRDSEIPR